MLNAYHAYCSPEAQENKHWCRDNFLDFKALQLADKALPLADKARKELQRLMKNEQIDLISTPIRGQGLLH